VKRPEIRGSGLEIGRNVKEFAHEARYDNEFIPQPQVKEAQGGL